MTLSTVFKLKPIYCNAEYRCAENCFAECLFAECHYAVSRYPGCHGAKQNVNTSKKDLYNWRQITKD
jgi:hypothetical protein